MTKHTLTPDSITAAKALVSRLCENGHVRMSVPVDFARDEDMLICALINAAEKSLAPTHPAEDGYVAAFYEIASLLGIGARADTPANVFRNEMLPRLATLASPQVVPAPFQNRVQPWLMACFGEMIAGDREERNHRFLEEALELVQACNCTASEAHQLVDYVFGRPVGEKVQEVGGVMVTLAALCLAQGLDMHDAAEVELARIWTKVEKIRAKQAAKPKHSPLPEAAAPAQEGKP